MDTHAPAGSFRHQPVTNPQGAGPSTPPQSPTTDYASAPNPAMKRPRPDDLSADNLTSSDHSTELSSNPAIKVRRFSADEARYRSLPERIADGDCQGVHERLQQAPSLLNKTDPASSLTPLCLAARSGQTEIVNLLLDAGADINGLAKNDETALMMATRARHDGIVSLLCARGAQSNLATLAENDTALHIAARQGDIEIVDMLLNARANPNLQNNADTTPLMLACASGKTAAAHRLIQAGAAVNAANVHGDTALHFACSKGLTDLVALLLENRARVNRANKIGETPLLVACKHGQSAIATRLIEQGAAIDVSAASSETALTLACASGALDLVTALLARGAAINQLCAQANSPLRAACEGGHTDIARQLLEAGADIDAVDENGETALSRACKQGTTALVALLLAHGAAINQRARDDASPLIMACRHGHTAIASMLIDAGADIHIVDENTETALVLACENGDTDLVALLLARGATVNPLSEEESIPLIAACYEGHTAIAAMLIKAGARIDAATQSSATPLSAACRKGTPELVKLLLAHNAAVNPLPNVQYPALDEAIDAGHTAIAQTLIEAGANLHAINGSGESALHAACRKGTSELVILLLEAGITINDVSEDGLTPFMVACEHGHTAAAALLLDAGAIVGEQRIALNLACKSGALDLVALLMKRGAAINSAETGVTTPLMAACEYGHAALVNLLIDGGADINATDAAGNTALMLACSSQRGEIVEILLRHPGQRATINRGDYLGKTALMKACTTGKIATVEKLIAAGATVDIADLQDDTALNHVLSRFAPDAQHQTELVRVLVEAGAQLDRLDVQGMTPLHKAVTSLNMSKIRLLVSAGADVQKPVHAGPQHGANALDLALLMKDHRLTEYLLSKNATPSFLPGNPPVRLVQPSDSYLFDLVSHGALIAAPDCATLHGLQTTGLIDKPAAFCATLANLVILPQTSPNNWSLWLEEQGMLWCVIEEIAQRMRTLPALANAVAMPGQRSTQQQKAQLIAHLLGTLTTGGTSEPYADKGLSWQTENRFNQMAQQQRALLARAGQAGQRHILGSKAAVLIDEALRHYSLAGELNHTSLLNSLLYARGLFAQTANRLVPLLRQAFEVTKQRVFDAPTFGARIGQSQAMLSEQVRAEATTRFHKLLQEEAMSNKPPPGFRESFARLQDPTAADDFANAVFNQWSEILTAQGITLPGVVSPSLQ